MSQDTFVIASEGVAISGLPGVFFLFEGHCERRRGNPTPKACPDANREVELIPILIGRMYLVVKEVSTTPQFAYSLLVLDTGCPVGLPHDDKKIIVIASPVKIGTKRSQGCGEPLLPDIAIPMQSVFS